MLNFYIQHFTRKFAKWQHECSFCENWLARNTEIHRIYINVTKLVRIPANIHHFTLWKNFNVIPYFIVFSIVNGVLDFFLVLENIFILFKESYKHIKENRGIGLLSGVFRRGFVSVSHWFYTFKTANSVWQQQKKKIASIH